MKHCALAIFPPLEVIEFQHDDGLVATAVLFVNGAPGKMMTYQQAHTPVHDVVMELLEPWRGKRAIPSR